MKVHDTIVTALSTAGFLGMEIVIGQIGWPTNGAANATSSVAEIFIEGLMEHLHRKSGTPLRPHNPPMETYVFSLLDEDQRSIVTGNFERHWGIFTFDGNVMVRVVNGVPPTGEYSFAKYNKSVNIVKYTNEEYEKYLTDLVILKE